MQINGSTLSDAWERSIIALLKRERLVHTQRGCRAAEVLGMQITVDSPATDPQAPRCYAFGQVFVDDYCQNLLSTTGAEHSVASRIALVDMARGVSINQMEAVTNILVDDRSSRRAVIGLWDGATDAESRHPPCLVSIQFLVRDDSLVTVAHFRSNDSWMAAFPDMVAVSRLAGAISAKLEIPLGKYVHFASSYHLYEMDIVPARAALDV